MIPGCAVLALLMVMVTIESAGGLERFRAPHDASTLRAWVSHPGDWIDGLVAFEGVIAAVRVDRHHQVLRVKVDESQTGSSPIPLWVVYQDVDASLGSAGDRVRMLGYFSDERSAPLESIRVPSGEARMLCVATINLTSGQAWHMKEASDQWTVWAEGGWPRSFLGAPAPDTPVLPTGPYAKAGAYDRGKKEAENDVRNGVLQIKQFGLPPRWIETYRAILSAGYGVELQLLGCVSMSAEEEYARGYNHVSERAIDAKVGAGTLAIVRERARNFYEQNEQYADEIEP